MIDKKLPCFYQYAFRCVCNSKQDVAMNYNVHVYT